MGAKMKKAMGEKQAKEMKAMEKRVKEKIAAKKEQGIKAVAHKRSQEKGKKLEEERLQKKLAALAEEMGLKKKYTTDKTLERARKKNEVSSKNEEAAQKTQERSSKKSELVQKSSEKIHKTVRKKLTGAKELGEKRQALATKVGKESDRKKAASDEMTQKKIIKEKQVKIMDSNEASVKNKREAATLQRRLKGAKELLSKSGVKDQNNKADVERFTKDEKRVIVQIKTLMASTAGASKQEANAGKEVEGSKVKTLKAKDAADFKELTSKLTDAEEKERERKAILKAALAKVNQQKKGLDRKEGAARAVVETADKAASAEALSLIRESKKQKERETLAIANKEVAIKKAAYEQTEAELKTVVGEAESDIASAKTMK